MNKARKVIPFFLIVVQPTSNGVLSTWGWTQDFTHFFLSLESHSYPQRKWFPEIQSTADEYTMQVPLQMQLWTSTVDINVNQAASYASKKYFVEGKTQLMSQISLLSQFIWWENWNTIRSTQGSLLALSKLTMCTAGNQTRESHIQGKLLNPCLISLTPIV